ncbi:MAG: metallophosphoesterase [Gaiellaceae bacterium]
MFRKRDSSGELAIFFATDLHGSNVCFKKFVNAGRFYGAGVLILGGDVTGKMMVPIARQEDGSYLTSFAGKELKLDSDDDAAALETRVSDMGFYPKRMSEDEFQELRDDPEGQEAVFHELIRERLEEWIEYARPRLVEQGVKCFAAPGNDDAFFIDDLLADSGAIELLEGRVVEVDGIEMLTTGWSNETPWKTERETSEVELRAMIVEMIERLERPENAIFNIHVPPHATALDQCPKLDEDLRPVSSGGNPVMTSAGSTAVRELIETHQPLLGLHGHIHEGRGIARIDRTVCVNPGSNYSEGVLNGSLIKLRQGEVRDVHLTQG